MTITMSCDIESRRSTPERRASWHETCADPQSCDCRAHVGETPKTPAEVAAERWPTARATKNNSR